MGLRILDLARMDSQSRAFEAPLDTNLGEAATPLRCHRTMKPQALVPWTPTRLMVARLMPVVSAPVLLEQPSASRRRA